MRDEVHSWRVVVREFMEESMGGGVPKTIVAPGATSTEAAL